MADETVRHAELEVVFLRKDARGFLFRLPDGRQVLCGPHDAVPDDLTADDEAQCLAWLENWKRSDARMGGDPHHG